MMRGKEFWKSVLMLYFVVVTLIDLAIFVLGTCFLPDAQFGYDAFLAPLFYGALSIIPYCVVYSSKELSVKQYIFREVLQLLAIEATLTFVVFGAGSPERRNFGLIAAFMGSILIIYIISALISLLFDHQSAKRMTESLHRYQDSVEGVGDKVE